MPKLPRTPREPGGKAEIEASPLGRHGHGIASISNGEVIVYGGYAATSEKLGTTSAGGFVPNRAYVIRHSTPEAAKAVQKAEAEFAKQALAASETAAISVTFGSRLRRRSSSSTTAGAASTAAETSKDTAASDATASELASAADLPIDETMLRGDPTKRVSISVGPAGARVSVSPEPMEPDGTLGPSRAKEVRAIVSDISTLEGVDTEYEEEEEAPMKAAKKSPRSAASTPTPPPIAYGEETVEQLEEWVAEASASVAWLGEEEARLNEELNKLVSQAETEDNERERLETEMDAAEEHTEKLREHVVAQTKAGSAARDELEKCHIFTAAQLNDTLEAIEHFLNKDAKMLKQGEKERIMSKLRAETEVWLRESTELSKTLLKPETVDGEALALALNAAANSRGGLMDRVNSKRLELSALKVKLAHAKGSNEKEAAADEAANQEQQKQLRDARSVEVESNLARDAALAEISELIGRARTAEAALIAWQRHDRTDSHAGDWAATPSAAPSAAGAGKQLTGVTGLLRGVHGSEPATKEASAESLGMDTALRLAVRRVCLKREQSSGRWAQLVAVASAQQKMAKKDSERSVSETTVIKQCERKLHSSRSSYNPPARAAPGADDATAG